LLLCNQPRHHNIPRYVALGLVAIGLALLWLAAAWSYPASAALPGGGTSLSTRPSLGEWVAVPTVTANDLRDVDMVSSSLGFAVGSDGTLLRYNGTGWQVVDLGITDPIVDVFMLNASDGFMLVWAASGTDIYRYNGTVWSLHHNTTHSLNRIHGTSSSNVWIVGLNITVHWDGTQWSDVTIPVDRQLFAVQAVGTSDVWAFGQYEPVSMHGLILHNTGSGWTQVTSPAPQTIFEAYFTAPTDGWAMGHAITTTYVLRYDGVSWRWAYTNTYNLDRMYMFSQTDGWAISQDVAPYAITHFDGNAFTPVNNPATTFLNSIDMVSQQEGWIVGGGGTMLYYFDPSTPTPTPSTTATRTPTPTSVASVTATPCPMNFSDVHPTDFFYESVRYLYCAGVISGYSDGTFRPYANTTRGQLSKIVVLAEGWTIYTPPTPTFTDVPATDTFYQYIETAYNRGIISGYADGSFRPGNNVTRGQLCKIVVLAEGWPLLNPPTPTFTDVPQSDPFYQHIETAFDRGIISGYADGTFRPGNSATRGQICKIVYNAVIAP